MFLCLCRGGDDPDAMAFHGVFAFRGDLVVGDNHGDLFGIEQLGDAAFSEFVGGGQYDDVVGLLREFFYHGASGVIDIGEAIFLGVAVYAYEQLVYVVFPGAELCDGPVVTSATVS